MEDGSALSWTVDRMDPSSISSPTVNQRALSSVPSIIFTLFIVTHPHSELVVVHFCLVI